jgi:hypothetical protein
MLEYDISQLQGPGIGDALGKAEEELEATMLLYLTK